MKGIKKEEKVDRRRDGIPILKGGHALTLPAQLEIRTRKKEIIAKSVVP